MSWSFFELCKLKILSKKTGKSLIETVNYHLGEEGRREGGGTNGGCCRLSLNKSDLKAKKINTECGGFSITRIEDVTM